MYKNKSNRCSVLKYGIWCATVLIDSMRSTFWSIPSWLTGVMHFPGPRFAQDYLCYRFARHCLLINLPTVPFPIGCGKLVWEVAVLSLDLVSDRCRLPLVSILVSIVFDVPYPVTPRLDFSSADIFDFNCPTTGQTHLTPWRNRVLIKAEQLW